jgi:tetratricopeptide (TPR) repeat protein
MIAFAAALLAVAQPAPCPDVVTAEAFICRAVRATAESRPQEAAESFEQAALQLDPSNPEASRLWAAAGNMWIAAGQNGKAALALDKALAGTGLLAEQRGEALLDRARAAEAQDDLKTARARVNEAAATISQDPFLWYFSAALAIREGDSANAKASIGRALALAPNDPFVLFEAGHVAQFAGDTAGARDYWSRASAADPNGTAGKAAREALAMLDKPASAPAPIQPPQPQPQPPGN